MGLNVNVLRGLVVPSNITKKEEEKNNAETGGKTETQQPVSQEPADVGSGTVDQIENTYTYFSIYDGITTHLGNFYAETLAKMKGPENLNKRVFSQLYNETLNNVVKSALENSKLGNTLDFSQLAEDVKNQITTELEACNYDSTEYMNQQFERDFKRFSK